MLCFLSLYRVDSCSNTLYQFRLLHNCLNFGGLVAVPELGEVQAEFVSQELSKSDRPELTAAKTVISGGQ